MNCAAVPLYCSNVHMPLSIGDIAPDCILPDREGKEWNLGSDAVAGNPIAIVFARN